MSDPSEEAVEIKSPFAEEVRQRAASIRRKNSWKEEGRGAAVQYALDAGDVTGVFAIDLDAENPSVTEERIFHTADFKVRFLAGSPLVRLDSRMLAGKPDADQVNDRAGKRGRRSQAGG